MTRQLQRPSCESVLSWLLCSYTECESLSAQPNTHNSSSNEMRRPRRELQKSRTQKLRRWLLWCCGWLSVSLWAGRGGSSRGRGDLEWCEHCIHSAACEVGRLAEDGGLGWWQKLGVESYIFEAVANIAIEVKDVTVVGELVIRGGYLGYWAGGRCYERTTMRLHEHLSKEWYCYTAPFSHTMLPSYSATHSTL